MQRTRDWWPSVNKGPRAGPQVHLMPHRLQTSSRPLTTGQMRRTTSPRKALARGAHNGSAHLESRRAGAGGGRGDVTTPRQSQEVPTEGKYLFSRDEDENSSGRLPARAFELSASGTPVRVCIYPC